MQSDTTTLTIQQICEVPIHQSISTSAKSAYIVPGLENASLLSIGKLCDDNCMALFTKENLFVIKNDKLILQGLWNENDGLWDVMFPRLSNGTFIKDEIKTKTQSINWWNIIILWW